MGHRRTCLAIASLTLALAACGDPISDEHIIDEPFTLEPIEGTELAQVTLTERAVERLGIETMEVWTVEDQLAVPSSALWLDPKGHFWVYTNPRPLVYLRHEVTIADDNGEFAVLSSGPEDGTVVVSVGVSELYGTEVGVGK